MKYGFDFIDVPMRKGKPRDTGITITRDRMRPIPYQRMFLESYAPFVDYVKISHLSPRFYPEHVLLEKLNLYREFKVEPFLGGILFENSYAQGKLEMFFDYLKHLDIRAIELSDNVIDIPEPVLFDSIERCKDSGISVFVEWGEKYASEVFNPDQSASQIKHRLKAGASRVVIERAELDVAFDEDNFQPGKHALQKLVELVGLEPLVFEAETQDQLVKLIKLFGQDVNVGPNIDYELIPWLEPARAGVGREIGHMTLTKND